MHGLQRREDLGNFLPFFSTLLASDPELVSTLQVEHPLAPLRRITAAEIITPPVRTGRAWFDILSIPTDSPLPPTCNDSSQVDRLGLYRTAELIELIVRAQYCKLSIPVNQVVLMGHSLGAVAALEVAMATDLPLAGVIAMSGVLPRAGDYVKPDLKAYNSEKREYTVTMVHGTEDDILPFSLANASGQIVKNVMKSTGGGFQFKAIEGADHLRTFIQSMALYDIIRDALWHAFYC
ncbi:Phospholipase/Carboxylesterase [Gracilaria domingensis]|nr:Phospholipase/Carboxylesterase [Gracilaria domingensis]